MARIEIVRPSLFQKMFKNYQYKAFNGTLLYQHRLNKQYFLINIHTSIIYNIQGAQKISYKIPHKNTIEINLIFLATLIPNKNR